jgi:hypothetical protein
MPFTQQLINLCASLLLLIAFAMLTQRRLLSLINLFAMQGAVLALNTAIVAHSCSALEWGHSALEWGQSPFWPSRMANGPLNGDSPHSGRPEWRMGTVPILAP